MSRLRVKSGLNAYPQLEGQRIAAPICAPVDLLSVRWRTDQFVGPPGGYLTRSVLPFQLNDSDLTVFATCDKLDLVSFLHLVEHRRVLDPKYHGHRGHLKI